MKTLYPRQLKIIPNRFLSLFGVVSLAGIGIVFSPFIAYGASYPCTPYNTLGGISATAPWSYSFQTVAGDTIFVSGSSGFIRPSGSFEESFLNINGTVADRHYISYDNSQGDGNGRHVIGFDYAGVATTTGTTTLSYSFSGTTLMRPSMSILVCGQLPTNSGGGSSGTTTTVISGTVAVDNAVNDLWMGIIIIYIVMAGTIWFFRKR